MMSVEAVDHVLSAPKVSGAALLVSIVIAERADKFGRGCYAGIEDIARRANLCGFGELEPPNVLSSDDERRHYRAKRENAIRSAKRSVHDAEIAGVLADAGESPYGTRIRHVVMPDTVSGSDDMSGKPDEMSAGSDDMSGKPDTTSPKPPSEPSFEPSGEPSAAASAPGHPEEDPEFVAEVDAVFADWLKATGRTHARVTPKRRAAIIAGFGTHSRDELREAMSNWERSDWFSGRKARDHKVRNDLTDLLASADTIEELRELDRPQARATDRNPRGPVGADSEGAA